MVQLADIPKLEAIHMASLVPAEFLGVSDSLGSIAINKRACFAIVDDNFTIQATIIDGELIYKTNRFQKKHTY